MAGGFRGQRSLWAAAVAGSVLLSGSAQAAIVGYWRMESDTDPGATTLSVPNEVVGGSALTSTSASLATQVPSATVALTGAPNLASLNGDASINGTITPYAALDAGSFTVEFWARTVEGAGHLFSRATGQTNAATPAALIDGVALDTFNSVRARYVVSDGAGGGTQITLTPATAINLEEPWTHLAFTYDATTAVGSLYADGVLAATHTGTPGRALVWGTSNNIIIGGDMDGGGLSSTSVTGIFDELRIADTALAPSQFLNAVPEPSAAGVVLLGAAGLLARRRRANEQ